VALALAAVASLIFGVVAIAACGLPLMRAIRLDLAFLIDEPSQCRRRTIWGPLVAWAGARQEVAGHRVAVSAHDRPSKEN
jgi:hypothetical protein